jgi:adenylyl-sulfate kinase
MAITPTPGHVFWLFGLSGAGKSTLADALIDTLRSRGRSILALDGDALRTGLCQGLGFSAGDRAENLRRAAQVARLATDSGVSVIASFITPLQANRDMVADIIRRERCSLVFVDAPLAVCQQRDVKGLYSRAQQGSVPQMTGLSSPFEPPSHPDLVIHTAAQSPAESSAALLEFVLQRLPAPSP